MKIRYPYDILIFGVISSWLLGFLISLFESVITRNMDALLWFLFIGVLLIWLRKSELDKFESQNKLEWVESFFLLINLITFLFAFASFLVTFSEYWLAKEIRYFSLALGLPSLLAMIYWNRYKNHKTTN